MPLLETTLDWPELLRHPGGRDHMVQLYSEPEFLVEAVVQYLGAGLRLGEAGHKQICDTRHQGLAEKRPSRATCSRATRRMRYRGQTNQCRHAGLPTHNEPYCSL